jgi:hypothetical protein
LNPNFIDKEFLPPGRQERQKKDFYKNPSSSTDVMPAKAGIQLHINIALINTWIPACAGITAFCRPFIHSSS